MKLSAKMWPTAALVLAALGAWWWHGHDAGVQAVLRQQIKIDEAALVTLARQHRTDTLKVVRTRHTTDSILTRDTVWSSDTVVKLVRAERNACDALVGTCEQEKAKLREQIADMKKLRPSRFGCVVGGVASDQGVRPGVGCGLRFTR